MRKLIGQIMKFGAVGVLCFGVGKRGWQSDKMF